MDYDMSCGCHCHDLSMYKAVVESPWNGCSMCADVHFESGTVPPVKVTEGNVKAIIAETTIYTESSYLAIRYHFRIKTTPYPSALTDLMVQVVVSQELAQQSWLGAEELAHVQLAQHLNGAWKHGQPAWVAAALKDYDAYVQKPQVGGHAVAHFQNNWSPMSYYSSKEMVGGQTVVRDLATWLPGLEEAVICPASKRSIPTVPCGTHDTVQRMIVHLNDHHRWKRHDIADWLEALDVDLSFGAEPPPKPEFPPADRGQILYIVASTHKAAQYEARRRGRSEPEWRFVSTQDGSGQVIRGTRKVQYCVAKGTVVVPPLKQLLESQQAVQVGEETGGSESGIKDALVKEAYQKQLQYHLSKETTYWKDAVKLEAPIYDQGSEGSSVGYALAHDYKPTVPTFDEMAKWLDKLQSADPWPGEHVHHEPKPDPKSKALDAKKKNAHTAFTVNPTKKNPFKKK